MARFTIAFEYDAAKFGITRLESEGPRGSRHLAKICQQVEHLDCGELRPRETVAPQFSLHVRSVIPHPLSPDQRIADLGPSGNRWSQGSGNPPITTIRSRSMTAAAALLLKYQGSSHGIGGRCEVCERKEISKQVGGFDRIQYGADIPLLLRSPHLRAVIPQNCGEQSRGCGLRRRCVAFDTRLLSKKLCTSCCASRNDGNLGRRRHRPRKRSQREAKEQRYESCVRFHAVRVEHAVRLK